MRNEKAKDLRFLLYRILKVENFRMNTTLTAEGTKIVTPILKLLCRITPILFVSGHQSRVRLRVGRLIRVFFLAKFLHDICEVLENASFPIRKCFNSQVPILSSK